MAFRDDKVVRKYGYKFEHARIVQGCLIYLVFVGLSISGALDGVTTAYYCLAAVVVLYIAMLIYYTRKMKSLKKATLVAFLKTLVMPTSMIG